MRNLNPKNIKNAFVRRARHFLEFQAKKKIVANTGLWEELSSYIKKSSSTGCSFSDYWVLYSFVKDKKPLEILECSTGVSTIVMAYALKENYMETGKKGRITSIEESVEYYTSACKLLPESLKEYIEILQSPKMEGYYYFYRGVKYQSIPQREYDFVFIDGPTTSALSDGQKTFDFDFLDVVRNSVKPVSAIIDGRKSTFYVLSKIFGGKKAKWDSLRTVGRLTDCTRDDLKKVDDILEV